MIKYQWQFNQNTKLFIHENASEIMVCEIVAILSAIDELRRRMVLRILVKIGYHSGLAFIRRHAITRARMTHS